MFNGGRYCDPFDTECPHRPYIGWDPRSFSYKLKFGYRPRQQHPHSTQVQATMTAWRSNEKDEGLDSLKAKKYTVAAVGKTAGQYNDTTKAIGEYVGHVSTATI